jgi:hypothetical protein
MYRFRKYVSYGFTIINFCSTGVQYETPCIYLGKSLFFFHCDPQNTNSKLDVSVERDKVFSADTANYH